MNISWNLNLFFHFFLVSFPMLKQLEKLKQTNKEKIREAQRCSGGKFAKDADKQKIEKANQILRTKEELKRREKIKMFKEAQKELPDIDNDPEIQKLLDKQLTDDWSQIISQFQRQLESTNDLRCDIAGPEIYEPNDEDDPRVKFFKGIFKEWRFRLNELPDEQLLKKKDEIIKMWYTLFALQPLFKGLNENKLSAELTVNLSRIVKALKIPDFHKAYTAYSDMSIGKAIWPIGITEYAIHWKFSADRIASEKVLHIFNSEPGRNAVLAIRRLMNVYKDIHQPLNSTNHF